MSRRRLIRKSGELSLAAPQVVAIRFMRMLAAGASPGAKDRRESERMVSEKIAAFSEGWMAMAAQMYRLQQEWALFAMRQWWSPSSMLQVWSPRWLTSAAARRRMQSSMVRLTAAGLGPVHKRTMRNVRRLTARSSR